MKHSTLHVQQASLHMEQALLQTKQSPFQMKQDLPHVEQAFPDIKQTSPICGVLGCNPKPCWGKGGVWGGETPASEVEGFPIPKIAKETALPRRRGTQGGAPPPCKNPRYPLKFPHVQLEKMRLPHLRQERGLGL